MKRVLLGAVLLGVVAGLCACGATNGGRETGSLSSGEGGETGTVHFSLTGTVTGDTLAQLAIQNVFDTSKNYLIDCKKKNHQLNGEDFCDELIVLPPGVYEIIANPADPKCKPEQDHYKVVVKAKETVEQCIKLVCGEANGGLDVIVKVTEPPIVRDIQFTVCGTNEEANKFICREGSDIDVTVFVTDSDTPCADLNPLWLVNGSTTIDPPIAFTEQLTPLLDENGKEICRFRARIEADPPENDYLLTLLVNDGFHDANFTFPIHFLLCGTPN